MCLALPALIVEINGLDQAVVEIGGVRKECSLALVDDVRIGDYVILHAGYALARLDPEEAEATLRLFAEMSGMSDMPDRPNTAPPAVLDGAP
jgi:hydrogenase expression/formation protein HypC